MNGLTLLLIIPVTLVVWSLEDKLKKKGWQDATGFNPQKEQARGRTGY